MKVGKTAAGTVIIGLVIIAIVVAGVFFGGAPVSVGQVGLPPQQPAQTGQTVTGICTGTPQADLYVSLAAKGVSPSATGYLYNAEGSPITSATLASGKISFTSLQGNTTYTYEIQSTNTTTPEFYGVWGTIKTDPSCVVSKTIQVQSIAYSIPTYNVYLSDGSTKMSATSRQTLGLDDLKKIKINIQPTSLADKNIFSNGQAVLTCDYNLGALDGFQLPTDGSGNNISNLSPASNPDGHPYLDANHTATKSFYMLPQTMGSGGDFTYYLELDSKSSADPASYSVGLSFVDQKNGDIVCTIYDLTRVKNNVAFFKNPDSKTPYGDYYRDPANGANIGATNWSFDMNYS